MEKLNKPIFVTSPMLPDIDAVTSEIEKIWETKWLTNMGEKHKELESKLCEELAVPHLSLFNNGTIALLVGLKAFDLPYGSEVITTPFTFAATPHCIAWNGLAPVFCDIERETMCIDANKIESLITEKTSAILGVHVYGFPCAVHKINEIAQKYNLKVLYDAAHAFSTEIDGKGIGSFGDMTMFSFHATKLFHTVEGGSLTYNEEKLVKKIYNLRNFGIRDEETVEEVGINGKLNEIQAAIGLLNLLRYKEEKIKRAELKAIYDSALSNIKGIRIPKMPVNTTNSYQYYPIVIEDECSVTRDELYIKLKELNIITRKYFYPLCSDYACYQSLPSSAKSNLPVANDMKHRVLCLPFYGALGKENSAMICDAIVSIAGKNL